MQRLIKGGKRKDRRNIGKDGGREEGGREEGTYRAKSSNWRNLSHVSAETTATLGHQLIPEAEKTSGPQNRGGLNWNLCLDIDLWKLHPPPAPRPLTGKGDHQETGPCPALT